MRLGAVWLVWIALLPFCCPAGGQVQAPSEKLQITAQSAYTWSMGDTQVVQLEGPLTIVLDTATLSAKQAVLWLTPVPSGAPGEQHAEVELIGDASVEQKTANYGGDHVYVPFQVLSNLQINTSEQRLARNLSDTPLYRRAVELRRQAATSRPSTTAPTPSTAPTSRRAPAAAATQPPEPGMPLYFKAGHTDVVDTEEGNVAIVLWGDVEMRVQQPTGDYLQMQAQRAVLFTSFQSLHDLSKTDKAQQGSRKVTAVYLEDDARIQYVPTKGNLSEQRLRARQIYYELASDHAILFEAVVHTVLPAQQLPVIVRAKTVRQLSKEEFDNKGVQLTSSGFAVPSYSLGADRLYVRAEATGDPQFPEVVTYEGSNATLQAFDVPFFYLPFVAGSIGDRPGPLRTVSIAQRSDLGFGFLSDWGLFETLGQLPPKSLDAAYRADYFQKRGPGTGLDAAWGGGFLTDPEHEPWAFQGSLRSYFIYDEGTDIDYGRLPVKPGGPGYTPRGRIDFQHQLLLPDDWTAQVQLGYVSDPTFLEEWFPRQFTGEGPTNETAYIKRQRDTEQFSAMVEAQPNRLVTYSDRMAEQFEVNRVPELTYNREGDSLANDALTVFSDNSGDGLYFQHTRATLAQQGFRVPDILPGIPALGQTGLTGATTWRGDFRQEVDWPLNLDHFKVVPYLVGRYTQYSDSPAGGAQARFFGAAGTRVSTTFWKVDPTAESDILDIHQLRHVVEPTLNLFTSGTTTDRNRLFMYDTSVDAINDISAVDVGLHQRWQTQRGGADHWRSVDAFSLDIDGVFFSNKPSTNGFRNPYDFRGVFFSTAPETSVPRNALNANGTWRLTDTTVVLGDAQYNLDARKLATAALGLLVVRDITQSWYIGDRYIADLNSNIATIQFQYQISPKYTVGFGQSWDFGLGQDVASSLSVVRYFDRFVMVFAFSHDEIANQTGFSFSIAPTGLGFGLNSDALQGPFRR
ncbi:MAG TPA: LPS assembly protein LptD [Tepidisphaeraceae bacterium]|nr:LPS assembly protein LptD [Tepidisphaeraceae bacterium]